MNLLQKLQVGFGSVIMAIVFYLMLAAPAFLTDMRPDLPQARQLAATYP